MTARNKNIPSLRFMGYSGNWIEKRLSAVAEIYDGTHQTPTYVAEGIPFYSVEHVTANQFIETKFISKEVFEKENKRVSLEKGDILMTRIGDIGTARLIDWDVKASFYVSLALIKKSNHIDSGYLSQYIASQFFQLELWKRIIHVAFPKKINLGEIGNCYVKLPLKEEQQKIASFLSAIDERIRQLTRRKELLEQYKKGVMQQLFSGKLRFKDEQGKAYPKWEEKLYEDIFTFYTTNSLSREKLNYDNGSVKNIHYGDIHTKFKTLFDLTRESVPFINDDVDLSKVKAENYCQEGDLVIADASEDYADIGKSIELVNLNKQKVVAGLHTFLARPAKSKTYKGFSGYLVQAPYVRKQIMTIAQGTKVLSLSPSRLGKVKLQIPSINEQQKIASFLSSIDTKIESVSAQIEGTKGYKKGLLQQMFV